MVPRSSLLAEFTVIINQITGEKHPKTIDVYADILVLRQATLFCMYALLVISKKIVLPRTCSCVYSSLLEVTGGRIRKRTDNVTLFFNFRK